MSKKNKSQVMEMDPTAEEPTAEEAAQKLAEFKAKKRESALAWKEKKNAEKQDRKDKAAKFIEYAKGRGIWDDIPAEYKEFLINLSTDSPAVSTQSTFTKIFGNTPAVGQKVSLMEVFQKTLKGKAAIDHQLKQWQEKGIIVSFTENKENIFDSVYTIKSLASGASVAAE